MHSTWAVPTWREGIILHPVQVAKKGRTCGDGRSWGTGREMVGTVWTIDIHKEKGRRDQTTSSCIHECPLSQAPALWPLHSARASTWHLRVRRPRSEGVSSMVFCSRCQVREEAGRFPMEKQG